MRSLKVAIASLAIAALTACGGSSSSTPVSNVGNTAGAATGTLTIALAPASAAASSQTRRPQFASPSATSLGWSLNGGSTTFADISASSSACTTTNAVRTCSIPVSAPAGNATFAVSLFDQSNGGGNLLGQGTSSANVAAGTGFTVSVNVNPVVGGVVLTMTSPNAKLNAATPATLTGTLTFTDPDGQVIPPSSNAPFLNPVVFTPTDSHISASPATATNAGQTSIIASYDGSLAAAAASTIVVSVKGTTVTTFPIQVNGGISGTPSPATSPTPTSTATPSASPAPTATASTQSSAYCSAAAPASGTVTFANGVTSTLTAGGCSSTITWPASGVTTAGTATGTLSFAPPTTLASIPSIGSSVPTSTIYITLKFNSTVVTTNIDPQVAWTLQTLPSGKTWVSPAWYLGPVNPVGFQSYSENNTTGCSGTSCIENGTISGNTITFATITSSTIGTITFPAGETYVFSASFY